jgi:hypothetical protein
LSHLKTGDHRIKKYIQDARFKDINFESLDEKYMEKIQGILELETKLPLAKGVISSFKQGFKKETIPKEIMRIAESRYEQYHFLLSNHSADCLSLRN